ncbi:hypothetical protein GGQ21_002855 [Salinibacter ruber]|nr:hypothetical protein [Salinibacter ruber]MCS3863219.1 hypothetical protein [Salinibacter ruber]
MVSPERTEPASMDTDVLSVLDIYGRKMPFSEVYSCLLRVCFDFGSDSESEN